MSQDRTQGSQSGVARGRVRRWWRDIDRFDHERLAEAIQGARAEVRARPRDAEGGWFEAANEHLRRAEELLKLGEIDGAWTAVKTATRELIEAYGEPDLLLEADRIGREATDKLHGWRGKSVNDALSDTWSRLGDASRLRASVIRRLDEAVHKEDQSAALRETVFAALGEVTTRSKAEEVEDLRRRVKAARAILDEHSDNVYRRLRLLSGHLLRAGLLLVALLVLVVVVLAVVLAGSDQQVEAVLGDMRSVIVILTLGAVGAATSGLLTLLRPDAQARIPDMRAKRYLVWLRPLVGAAAALGVVVILRSGIGGVRIEQEAIYAVAFSAGFSERLVSRAVEVASAAISG